MKSHVAGQDNKVRHLAKVHVHPLSVKPFVFNYYFSCTKTQIIFTWPGGECVCAEVDVVLRNSAEMPSR